MVRTETMSVIAAKPFGDLLFGADDTRRHGSLNLEQREGWLARVQNRDHRREVTDSDADIPQPDSFYSRLTQLFRREPQGPCDAPWVRSDLRDRAAEECRAKRRGR